MNSIQENPFSNSNNIIQTAYDYFQLKIENKDTFSFYELPTGITKEMLYKELKCMDLTSYYEIVSAEYLWKQYVYIQSNVHIYVYVCICMHIYMYIYICIYLAVVLRNSLERGKYGNPLVNNILSYIDLDNKRKLFTSR
jgi:hypothetical protein